MTFPSQEVVAVEFGWETAPRSFATLLPPDLRERYHRIDPLRNPAVRNSVQSLGEQADYWTERVGSSLAPRIMLGYCSGSALAAELASRAGREDVRLILIDPVFPTVDEASDLLAEIATQMDDGLSTADVPNIWLRSDAATLGVIGEFLRGIVERRAPDVPADVVDALTEKQRAWLSYTLASAEHGDTMACDPDHVLLSRDGVWDRAGPGKVHRFPTGPVELFADLDAAALVTALVAAHSTTLDRTAGDDPWKAAT